jgi:deoxyxylulose-5-phosphate synthase
MEYCFLDKVNSPTDLKKLSDADILKYIEEVRAFLIETVENQRLQLRELKVKGGAE